jgi:hypothetical protein
MPTASGVLGQIDPAALAEVQDHLLVVGSSPWIGMQGTGEITYARQDPTLYAATLSNMGFNSFRLDAQSKKGQMSIRIHRGLGEIQSSDGTILTIPSETAVLGLFPFERLRAANFPEPDTSLIDHGLVTVDGVELHRITFESKTTNATDLYFDPSTHLLVKTANAVFMDSARRATFLSVVTYGDYRKVGAILIPFSYAETIEGEQYRTLRLSDVQLNPGLTSSYFSF